MVPRVDKFIETESRTVVIARGWGKEARSQNVMGEEGGAGAGEDCGPQLGAGVLPASVLDTQVQ